MADPKIKYDIEADVKGQAEVGQLAAQVESLAAGLDGPLKASAQASARALRDLAQKDAAIANFVSLKREALAAADSLAQAQRAAQTLGSQLASTENPTRSQAGAMQKLRDAVQAAKTEVIAKSSALDAARNSLSKHGIDTDNLSQKQITVRKALGEVRAEVTSHTTAWQAAATASANSSASQSRSHRVIKEGVDSISSQLKVMQGIYASLAGLQTFETMLKDVAATADAYNNLGARIKLVTGEGASFSAAFEGITAVSQRTSSSLESTGNLFAKLADAGKAMGVGQADALKLTETVNQAVQLSGASAQASDAAITQLIQGLQGGALRGDEFNSVMEQSPRLARALADGLGVTTGELRKMAEAGQLSSQSVITALQRQADTVAGEFSKLPPTVGRALQNLSNSWTLYVGETDKASGASSAAATAINALAKNLSTVAGYLIDAGQAAAAFAALRLAQHFAGIATSASLSATAVAANATAVAATGAAATTASVAMARFAAILSTLRTFTLIGIIANFKDIGTWIGEGIAKLQGYKDKTQELAEADRRATEQAQAHAAARKRQADAIQAAADRSFGLTKEAAALVREFDEMRAKGDSAAEAVGKIGKEFDLSSIPGIRDAAAVLDKLASDGKLSATEFQKAWADALRGEDLAAFETKARAALDGTAQGAERLAHINDALLRESVNRVADTYALLAQKSSATATSAINDTELMIKGMDRLKAQGVDTSAALTASLGKGIDTASTQKDLDTIKTQIEQVRRVLGDKVADGLLEQAKTKAEELRKKLDDLTPGIQSAREAMRVLGITSDAELKKIAASSEQAYTAIKNGGTASTRELQEAFRKYAAAAIAANNGVASESLKVEAAVRGVTMKVDDLGKASIEAASKTRQANEDVVRSYIPWGEAAEKVAEKERLAREKVIATREKEISLIERANTLTERAIALENKRRGVDKEGFSTDKNGGRLVAGSDLGSLTGIAAFLKSAGVADDAAARNLAREFADEKGNVLYANNPGQRKYGGETLSMALLKAAESYTFGVGSAAKQSGVGQEPASIPAQPAKTYNVTVGSRTVRTVSDNDAQALMQILSDAQRAA